MNKHPFHSVAKALPWGALENCGVYLIIGSLLILFSDEIAARFASSEETLATISIYKGWGFVLITGFLLYWLIQRHTGALRTSEMQLQSVIDAMPAFIAYVDKDRYYRLTNHAYKEQFQDTPVGKHIEEVIGEQAYESISKYVEKVLDGEVTSYEMTIPIQGQEIFLSTTYIPDTDVDGRTQGFFVLAQNITERRQAQEELRQWADAFEGCAHGIAIGDPNTNRIVVCNPAFAKMHKIGTEEIIGSAILSLF